MSGEDITRYGENTSMGQQVNMTHLLETMIGEHKVTENDPGVYTHTFTPPYWINPDVPPVRFDDLIQSIYEPPTENAGTLTLADVDRMLDWMREAKAKPDYFYISVKTKWLLWRLEYIRRLNRAHPLPHRKIRKCHTRSIYEVRRKGMAHIRRVEQAERAREAAEMARLVKEQG